jgi:hypothetical protein
MAAGALFRLALALGVAASALRRIEPLAAQIRPTGRLELGLNNQYHWRGIRRSDAPSLAPAAALALGLGDLVWLSVGGWATFELAEADEVHRSDLVPGQRGHAETDGWIQAEINQPGWSASLGLARASLSSSGPDPSITEAFLKVEWISSTPAPRLELWHDLNDDRGTYLEAGLDWLAANPLGGPGLSLAIGGAAGFVAGGHPSLTSRFPGFTDNGFTHAGLRLNLGLTPSFGPVEATINVRPELQLSFDPATKATCRGGCPQAVRGWVSGSIGLAFPRRRRP